MNMISCGTYIKNGGILIKGNNLCGPVKIDGFGENVFIVFLEERCEISEINLEAVRTKEFVGKGNRSRK